MYIAETCHRGTGNVYDDLGFPDAEEMQAKAVLASRIVSIIEQKQWIQVQVARSLGVTQPKISLLCRGRFSGFPMERLVKLLNKLSQDIEFQKENVH